MNSRRIIAGSSKTGLGSTHAQTGTATRDARSRAREMAAVREERINTACAHCREGRKIVKPKCGLRPAQVRCSHCDVAIDILPL